MTSEHKISFNFLKKHKVKAAIAVGLLIIVGYYIYNKYSGVNTETRYVFAQAEKGTLISSISGTGQVSASGQVDLKTKASGDVVYVGVKTGQEVKSGTIVVQLNAKDVAKSLRDATANLESAKIALEKLRKPVDALTIVQAENSLAQAQESKQRAEDDLKKAYDDGFNAIANAFLDLPNLMSGLADVVYGYDLESNLYNVDWYANRGVALDNDNYDKIIKYRDDVKVAYDSARAAYDKNFDDYKTASRNSDIYEIDELITQTYETTRKMADAVKSANNVIDYVQDIMEEKHAFYAQIQTVVSDHQAALDTYTSKTNSHLSSLLSIKSTIQNSKLSMVNAGRTIEEKTAYLSDIKSGADVLDLKSAQLTLQQRLNSLQDARDQYANYVVRAPFEGIVAKLSVKKADDLSSGTAVATLITKQKIAEISLNEIDVAKLRVGQKAIITFDAVEDLTITGTVAEIDMIGTATQGVVSYAVKISFDVQDEKVKPGMSLSANIILDNKADVLMVPSSAVKTSNGENYVEEIDAAGNVIRKIVQIGMIGDTSTEIVEGLSEGEQIIGQKITTGSGTVSAASKSVTGQSSRNSGFPAGGMMQIMR